MGILNSLLPRPEWASSTSRSTKNGPLSDVHALVVAKGVLGTEGADGSTGWSVHTRGYEIPYGAEQSQEEEKKKNPPSQGTGTGTGLGSGQRCFEEVKDTNSSRRQQ